MSGDDERRFGGPGDEGLNAFLPTKPTSLFPTDIGKATSLDKQPTNLTAAQAQVLAGAGLGPNATDIDLGGNLGTYRVIATYQTLRPRGSLPSSPDATPGVLVVGLPMTQQERTVQQMVVLAISTVAAGIILVALIGTWLVRRNLEPLRRLAATATKVSQTPLDSGKVALGARVDPIDTDTRTEVGQVGAAFNEMLDHVDEALNARHQSEQRVRQFVADASHEPAHAARLDQGLCRFVAPRARPRPADGDPCDGSHRVRGQPDEARSSRTCSCSRASTRAARSTWPRSTCRCSSSTR